MENIFKNPLPLFCALFSHPFYTFYKRIAEQSGLPVKDRLLHFLECTALLLVILRLSSLATLFNYGSQFTCDPLGAYIARHLHLYDRYVLACQVCLLLYTLLLNVQLFLGKNLTNASNRSLSWQSVAYDLIVRNVDQAQKCLRFPERSNLSFNQANSKIASLSLFYHQIQNDLLQKQLDLGKFANPRWQLAIFTFLSVTNRKKCFQFQVLSDLIARFLPLLSFILPLIGVTLHILLGVLATPGSLNPLGMFLLLFDFTLIWIYCFLIYRNVLLQVYLIMIISLAIKLHIETTQRMFAYFIAKSRSRPVQGLNIWNRLLLGNILTEHAQLCTLLDTVNEQFISLSLFVTFLLIAPSNIYFIYRLVYRPIRLIEFTVILLFILSQFIFLVSAVVPPALANESLYRTGKYLPGVQLSVLRGERCRSLKFKFEILQSTLTESRVKSGASFGPVCLITFESLYKVVSLYAVYLLVFFDLLPK